MKPIDNVIHLRRAIYPKQYTGEKISKNIIKRIIENGNMAPSHKLTQPWLFKIFNSSSKQKLANEMIKKYNESLSNLKDNERKIKKIINKCELSEYIIAICMKRDKNNSIPEWEEIAATAMAVQNMWLTCVSYEIGCYWSTPKYANELGGFLNLDKNERCLGLFYIGKFNHKNQKPTKRNDINTKIEWFN